MTTTVLNPSNPGAVNLYDIAPKPSGSRFLRNLSPEGINVASHTESVYLAYDRLLADRRERVTPVPPPMVTVRLKFASRTAAGEWVLVPRGQITRIAVFETSKPTKFAKMKAKDPGAILDSFFLGEQAWTVARDDALYEALRDFLCAVDAPPHLIRGLNDRLVIGLCLRAGLDVHASELPNVGIPHTD